MLYTLNHHANMDWSVPDCYMFELMVEIIPQMFHTASNWLTLGESNHYKRTWHILEYLVDSVRLNTILSLSFYHSLSKT